MAFCTNSSPLKRHTPPLALPLPPLPPNPRPDSETLYLTAFKMKMSGHLKMVNISMSYYPI